jgi:Flp pilus assembly protein TadD
MSVRGFERYRADAAAVVLVMAVSFLIYSGSLGNGFVYDDKYVVLENPYIRDLDHISDIILGDVWSFRTGSTSSYYRPMLHFAFIGVYKLFGLKPLGYHLLSVMLHSLNSALVYLLAATVFGKDRGACFRPALAAAALFAAHPVQTEPVNWISSFSDVSYVFFLLVSFIFYVRFNRWTLGLAASLVFFVFALLSKETALVLPVLIAAYEYSSGERPVRPGTIALRCLPYVLAGAAYIALRDYAIGGLAPAGEEKGLGPLGYLINVFPLYAEYMGKLVLPVNLNVFHVFEPVRSVLELKFLLSFVVFAAYAAALYVSMRKARRAFFLLLWIAVPVLPVLYIPAVGLNVFSERYLYLSVAGFSMLLALGVERLDRARPSWNIALIAFISIALLYSAGTMKRNHVWADSLRLWTDTVEKSPGGYVPHNNLGEAYYELGMLDRAIEEFQKAIELKPGYADAHNNLGSMLGIKGQYEEAVEEFRKAIRSRPGFARAHNNLGVAFMNLGRHGEAEGEFETALGLDPENAEFHRNLGGAYGEQGRYEEAEREYLEALRLRPEYDEAHNNLGVIHYVRGDYGEAVREFQEAVRLNPQNAYFRGNLESARRAMGRSPE